MSSRFIFTNPFPVGPYYKEGVNPIPIYVEDKWSGLVGGVGDAKTGGIMQPVCWRTPRLRKGFTQVLWLDSKEHRFCEEVGSMNMFFVFGDKLVTPALNGSILPGITRDSILKLAPDMGYEAEERAISIDEVIEGIAGGRLTECFGSGTAAVISPVGSLHYRGRDYRLGEGKTGQVTGKLYNRLVDIQYGRVEDPYGWVQEIGKDLS